MKKHQTLYGSGKKSVSAFFRQPFLFSLTRALHSPGAAWIGLILLSLAIAMIRLHTYGEPAECDAISFAAGGDAWLKGRHFYSDFGDNKPPLIYLTFAAAQALVGSGPPAFYLLSVTGAILGLAGIFLLGRRYGGNNGTGLVAALFWALVSGYCALEANQPRIETFINVLNIWIIVLLLGQKRDSTSIPRSLGVGILFLLGTLYKPQVILLLIVVTFFNLTTARSSRELRVTAAQFGWTLFIVTLGWASLFAYFGWTGRFHVFWVAMVDLARFHAGNPWINLFASLSTSRWIPDSTVILLPLAFFAVAGCFSSFGKNQRPWLLWIAWSLAVFIEIAIPGHFYRYYYQLWIPVACVGAAWGLEVIASRIGKSWALGMILLTTYFLSFNLWLWDRHSPNDISYGKYRDTYVYNEPVGKIIQEWLLPNETFYEWCYIPHFYLSAHKTPVTSILFAHQFFAPPPLGPELSERALKELSGSNPELLVIDRSFEHFQFREMTFPAKLWKENPVYQYLEKNYRFFMGAADNRFMFLCRKGGALEKRLKKAGKLPVIDVYVSNFR
jgi:hypothetical protein